MFFDLIDIALVNSDVVYAKLGMKYHYWIWNLLWQKLSLIDTVIIRDCSPLAGQASENLMNHPCSEKFQPICPSSRRSEGDVIICKNEDSDHKKLVSCKTCCLYLCLKERKERNCFLKHDFSFPSRLHCLLYAFLKIIYSCVDCLVSFHHKCHIFCAAKYVILKIICNSKGLLKEYLSQ